MHKLSAGLQRVSNTWSILLSIILYAIFLTRVMAPESATVSTYAGDWGSPDGHWFYTPDELYGEIAHWGDAGRAHYVDFRLGLDPVWAFVYTFFLITITSTALRSAFPADDGRQRLNLIALIPMLADLAENGLGIVIMTSYPQRLDALAWITTTVSATKWFTLVFAHLVMVYALGAAFLRRFVKT